MALSYQELRAAVPVVLQAGHVPNIVGEAGIGKSALVADIATQMGAQLFTTVVSLSEKGDLAIPVPPLTTDSFVQTKFGRLADVQFGYAHTLIEIIQFAEKQPDKPIIWFLDEFNRGSQAVQSELMNLVLQRQINDITLPVQVQLIIAENPDAQMAGFNETFYGVTAGDDAIKDRTTRLVMRVDITDWLTWARAQDAHGQTHIDPAICDYLAAHPTSLRPVKHDDDVYPTPRAWQRVSDVLRQLATLPVAQQNALRFDLLTGDLGLTVGMQFDQFLGAAVTVAELLSSDDTTTFMQLSIGAQQALLVEAGTDSDKLLTNPENAKRWLTLMRLLPSDGQYAVVHTLGNHSGWLAGLTTMPTIRDYVLSVLNQTI
ncbi:ATP-binding protein [Furfurilactobacillus siliginis]|uniref:ATPase n=1 Tax=Furfurilactobacillus siliginis TaxID=348151 RepID=A0A0R2L976_9LACO|nr:ATP-binding protein [Furfurilactobacillus siliginis]KRN95674.1 hypothetical protein IV55_GL001775 [Furfurilactobacillus siliginis]GEK28063.1 ATPase [Furfurilactobacillus siliginis]